MGSWGRRVGAVASRGLVAAALAGLVVAAGPQAASAQTGGAGSGLIGIVDQVSGAGSTALSTGLETFLSEVLRGGTNVVGVFTALETQLSDLLNGLATGGGGVLGASGGLLPSTTTIASTAPTGSGKVTLTATVSILGLRGAVIAPTGDVAFTDLHAGTTVGLGGGAINSPCLLDLSGFECTASLTSTLPAGTNTLTASWPGDVVGAGSNSPNLTINVP